MAYGWHMDVQRMLSRGRPMGTDRARSASEDTLRFDIGLNCRLASPGGVAIPCRGPRLPNLMRAREFSGVRAPHAKKPLGMRARSFPLVNGAHGGSPKRRMNSVRARLQRSFSKGISPAAFSTFRRKRSKFSEAPCMSRTLDGSSSDRASYVTKTRTGFADLASVIQNPTAFWGRRAQTCWLGLLSTAWSRRSHPTIPRKWRDAHFENPSM